MIINFNGLKWLHRCLSSVFKTDYPNFNVYLIDNGSIDGSVDYVKSNFPRAEIIRFVENLGFAEAYNRAIEKIEANYVVLLNNDTEILNPKWIQNLVNVAIKDSNIAAVACKMLSMNDPSCLDSVGGMGIPFWRGFIDIGRREFDKGQYDRTDFEPFSFCGGAVLMRRDIFVRLSGFDSKFFMYFEDADFSWRLRIFGYQISFAPEAKVVHYFSGSAPNRALDAKKLYLCHKNLLRTVLKNCGSSLPWALRNYLFFSLIVSLGFSILDPLKAVAIGKAILWNLVHFKDTYTWRLKIQKNKKEDEMAILRKMYPKIRRYEPSMYPNLRQILNILFEYNQQHKIY